MKRKGSLSRLPFFIETREIPRALGAGECKRGLLGVTDVMAPLIPTRRKAVDDVNPGYEISQKQSQRISVYIPLGLDHKVQKEGADRAS